MKQQQADDLAATLAAELGPSLAPDVTDLDQHTNEIRGEGWYPSGPRSTDPSSMFVLSAVHAVGLVLVIVFRWRDDDDQRNYMFAWDLTTVDYVHLVTEGWFWEQIDLKLAYPNWRSTRTISLSESLFLVR